MKKVFLGGTCNESKWRNLLIPMLTINYFNPIVDDWTAECIKIEEKEKKTSDFRLYTITPKLIGTYSIAEVTDDSNKYPNKTILVILKTDEDQKFSESQWKSLLQVSSIIKLNGAKVFYDLKSAALYMNI